jgi:hypothetical protein
MITLDYFEEYKKPFVDKILTLDLQIEDYKLEFRLFVLIDDKIEYRGYIIKKGGRGWLNQIRIGKDIEARKYKSPIGFNGPGVFNHGVKK